MAAARYGWTPFFTYARLFPTLLRVYMPGPFSMSLVARLGVEESAAHSVQMALTMYVAVLVLLSGVLGFVTKQREPLFIVVCLAAMLSPNIMWDHHFVFFLMPLLVWMAWSNFQVPVVLWCCGGFVLVQALGSRWVSGFYVHAYGHASILLLVLWQVYQVCGSVRAGKSEAGGRGTRKAGELPSERSQTGGETLCETRSPGS